MIPTVTLSTLFQIGSSKRVLKSQWRDSGVPFYRGREVTKLSQEGYVENDLFIDEDLYEELLNKHGVPTQGDIVITAIGTIGNTYIVKDDDKFYFKDASVLWLKKTSDVVSEYINYWFKSNLMREQLEVGNGATVDTLTISKLQSLIVPLPPIAEQKRIVALLDQAFADIDQARANAETNLKNARELFDSFLQQVFNQRGERWVEKKFSECFSLKSGDGLTAKNMVAGPYSVYGGNGVAGKHNDFNLSEESVIIGRVGELCGNARHIVEKIWLTDNAFKVQNFKFDFDLTFLTYLLNFKNLRSFARQAAQPVISNSSLSEVVLNFPKCLKLQSELSSNISVLNEQIDILSEIYTSKIKALDELKKSILQKAFTGELTKSKGIAA